MAKEPKAPQGMIKGHVDMCLQLLLDPERVRSAVDLYGGFGRVRVFDLLDQYVQTGILEPLPEPRCVNCQGTKDAPLRQLAKDGSVLHECRSRFHGGDVFGWGVVVERGKTKTRMIATVLKAQLDMEPFRKAQEDVRRAMIKAAAIPPHLLEKVPTAAWAPLAGLLLCKECGVLPKWDPTRVKGQHRLRCHGISISGSIVKVTAEWNQRFGQQPPAPEPFAIDKLEQRLDEASALLLCKKCGRRPKSFSKGMWRRRYECLTRGCDHPTEYVGYVQAREAWNEKYGQQPEVELLPCWDCKELPEIEDDDRGYVAYTCTTDQSGHPHEGGWCASEPQAREEWNRRYGRASFKSSCTKPMANCRDGHYLTPIGPSNFGFEGIDKIPRERWDQPNPYDLTPCSCGQIPRPVAVRWTIRNNPGRYNVWCWVVECGCGKSDHGGWNTAKEAIDRWVYGNRKTRPNIAFRRYDLPTDLVLGCATLPKEYRQ